MKINGGIFQMNLSKREKMQTEEKKRKNADKKNKKSEINRINFFLFEFQRMR